MSAFTDHPLRYAMSNELHAGPFPTVAAPGTLAEMAHINKPLEMAIVTPLVVLAVWFAVRRIRHGLE